MTLAWVRIWCIAVTVVVVTAFFLFERYTRAGTAMRATAEHEEAALACGVPVRRV